MSANGAGGWQARAGEGPLKLSTSSSSNELRPRELAHSPSLWKYRLSRILKTTLQIPRKAETSLDENEKPGSLVQNLVLFCLVTLNKSLVDSSVRIQVWGLNPGPITY